MRAPHLTKTSKIFAALLIPSLGVCRFAQAATATPPSKPPSAESLYQKSLVADDRFSYTGHQFLTVWRDDDRTFATATIVTHAAPDKDIIVYTAPHSRQGRVIIGNKTDQWTYVPQRGTVIHSTEPTDPTQKQEAIQFNLLLANYKLIVQPTPAEVAGRKTYEVNLVPRVPGRPYDKLWIDPFTGVALRREKYHSDGSISSVSYYSDIHFNPKLLSTQFTPNRWSGQKFREVNQSSATDVTVDPAKLPAGFQGVASVPPALDGYRFQEATMLGTGRKASLHLVYSDGLNTLSLFEMFRIGKTPTHVPGSHVEILSPGRFGHVSQRYAYSLLSWDGPEINYTLVGDMSVRALVALANFATPPPAPPPPAHTVHSVKK